MNSFVDKDPNFRIHYDVTGPRRKELVKALGEILLWEPKYLGAPDFWYQVGNYYVTKNGTIPCPESCTREIAEQIIGNLEKRGFQHTGSNLMLFVVSLPASMFDRASMQRLKNLVSSKETILKAALGAHKLQIEESEGKVYFPWFNLTGADGEAEAYTMLISALARTAKEQKRISATEKPQENMKYAMRLFLVRLGFVGNEYKRARKILLRELSGNCSWKAGHAPERRDTAKENEVPIEDTNNEPSREVPNSHFTSDGDEDIPFD